MDRVRSLFAASAAEHQEYEPLERDDEEDAAVACDPEAEETPFSWLEYCVFLFLGVAMLWAWNMFLASAPYFQSRFSENEWILAHFQSAIISVGTVTNLGSMLVLTRLQSNASYPKRIIAALILNVVVFGLLTLSTIYFRDVSAGTYLGFILAMVFFTATATGLCQNGAFAFAASFARPEYMQAIMAGQGIAGVLPPLAQIVSVLAIPEPDHWTGEDDEGMPVPHPPSTAAFIFFLTAVIVSVMALLVFMPLVRRHNALIQSKMIESITSIEEALRAERKVIGFLALYRKLSWLAASVFLCFAVTMVFPVFTSMIISVRSPDEAPRLFQPACFIPLAFLFWNIGDLAGRLSTILPLSISHKPRILFLVAFLRSGFLPLYLLCNIRGQGAAIPSDTFYLFVVQFGFGLTNGWLGSSCMMGAGEWVDEGEREAAGGFMGLNLVAGLTTGSLLSFAAASF